MDIAKLKEAIYYDGKIQALLEAVGCGNIRKNGKYFTCSNPDGDNPVSVQVFSEQKLGIINYTRDIPCAYNQPDIIDLIRFYRGGEMFSSTVKWICDTLGYKFYGGKPKKESSVKTFLKKTRRLSGSNDEEEAFLEEIPESCLLSYELMPNMLFVKDGIKPSVQVEFELGIDYRSEMISIPIRDELGTLVGVKGRIARDIVYSNESKYIYLEECPKSLVLYGLYKTYQYIMKEKRVYIVESEKAVMQLWSHGIKNAVSIGGHSISKKQAFLLAKMTGVEVIFCYDKDVDMKKVDKVTKKTYFEKERMKLPKYTKVGYMYDVYDRLNKKESPTDKMEFWNEYKIIWSD